MIDSFDEGKRKLKYCCEKFKDYATLEKRYTPIIRIIKLTSDYYFENSNDKYFQKSGLIFEITEAYSGEYKTLKGWTIIIDYCPFCGTNLHKFYTSQDYAHETEGLTFSDSNK